MCQECEWSAAIEQIEEIESNVGHVSVSNPSESAVEFCDSIGEKLASMREWIAENEHVTEKMTAAVERMGEAVAKWMH